MSPKFKGIKEEYLDDEKHSRRGHVKKKQVDRPDAKFLDPALSNGTVIEVFHKQAKVRLDTGTEDNYQSNEKGRNRIEDRIVSIYNDDKQFIESEQWSTYIQSIICVERKTSIFSTKEKDYKNRNEIAIYVSNYKLDAEQAHCLIRKHWFIVVFTG